MLIKRNASVLELVLIDFVCSIGITSAAVPSLAKPSGQSNAGNGVAKNILEYVVAHISEFKKLNQDQMFQGMDNEEDLDAGSIRDGGSRQQGRRPSDTMMIEGMAVSAVPRPRWKSIYIRGCPFCTI